MVKGRRMDHVLSRLVDSGIEFEISADLMVSANMTTSNILHGARLCGSPDRTQANLHLP